MKELSSWENSWPEAIRLLKQGSVLLTTTDTVLGLLAPATQQGFDRLNLIKGRQEKPYLILIDSPQKLSNFVDVSALPQAAQRLIAHAWPGPVTLIFKARQHVPRCMQSAEGTIAVRMPDHSQLCKVLEHFEALFSTSANLAGSPVPATLAEVDTSIAQQVALVIGDAVSKQIPSTIVDCTGHEVKIVRQGVVEAAVISQIINNS